jgi:glycosyltransferase involved in cell wall biosynthesis
MTTGNHGSSGRICDVPAVRGMSTSPLTSPPPLHHDANMQQAESHSSSPLIPSDTNPSLLIVLNGCLAREGKSIGGGDMVLFKFIRLARMEPDVLIPESAQTFVETRGRKLLTRRNSGVSLPEIIGVFLVRILQAIWRGWRNPRTYDVALAASPYMADVIPVWFWKARHKGAIIYHVIPERQAVNLLTRVRFALAALEQKITMGILRRACDFIVAGNEFTRTQLQARLPGKPIFVLPAGFDAAFIDGIPAEKKDPALGCFVGRMVSQKGIFDLLRVMPELARTNPEFKLVMAGTGPEREAFAAEVQRLKLTNIELAGFISEAEKISLLKRSTYFFFPSYEEGWGIALAEALYCECRCLCYELPHYRSVFGELPVYARLGDAADLLRVFRASGPVPAGQKDFLRRYDDPLVATQLAEHLSNVARMNAGR